MSPPNVISIVEDDEDLRAALIGLFRSLNFSAKGYPSAEAFLSSGDVEVAGCIITDISLPGASGIDLKKSLDERSVGTPVIMMTARADADVIERALATRPFCLMQKPFATDALAENVMRAMSIAT